MATTEPTNFPSPRQLPEAYTTPPNSQPSPQQFSQQLPHQYPQQYPPQHSPMGPPSQMPPNASPTSPSTAFDLPLASRQQRQPKSPMYIPAALRPTERQHHPSPLTPPRSVHGSTDSLDNKADANRPISRRSTGSRKISILGNRLEDEPTPITIPTEDLPTVTGPPKRSHWKLDVNATICDAPVCQKHFGLWERRHHCRHCGDVFCGEHSQWQIPLDQNADFHPEGALVRACGHCWARYGKWVDERRERAERGEEQVESSLPVRAVLPKGGSGKAQEGRGSIAQSLTRDWNWSTF